MAACLSSPHFFLGGTATVFNAMSRRGICHAALEIQDAPGSSGTAAGGLLLALRGPWRAGTETLAAGEGLWWQGMPMQWQMAPLAAGAAMLVLTVSPA
jgi:hypothetical protein